ncbi:uncharacterized protein N7469_004518 [Penicillium citrinum]|uniref:Uncharacterized protein n=2 Tax=Penicillium TaxID=5073 RepID=A0A9W9P580_PENCI|nr:uncharacterized protein N7469_004518 [Penicillium citrinum]KAJ5235350.1 hypothetical protein N7469_004518 [Penicillium citrinum]KAJ5590979.1 hypothetical protein N7450_004951 [Penicillium hetheringtonii]
MKVLLPSIVSLGSSLWGYIYGEIPFPGIRSSNSLARRTLSSLQLAGSAYALGEILPVNMSSDIFHIPKSPESFHVHEDTDVLETPDMNNATFDIREPCFPDPYHFPSIPIDDSLKSGREKSLEGALLVLLVVNCGMLAKLIMYRHEDCINLSKSHDDQRQYIEGILRLYAGILPTAGNHILRLLDQSLEAIEGSIQRLHVKYEKFDRIVHDLEMLASQEHLDEAIARCQESHERLRPLPRDTSNVLSVILGVLEASINNPESS